MKDINDYLDKKDLICEEDAIKRVIEKFNIAEDKAITLYKNWRRVYMIPKIEPYKNRRW